MHISGGPVGQTKNGGAVIWMLILAPSLVVLGINFTFQQVYSSQESNARGIAADISVKSQQLAMQAKDAVAGSQNAFAKFQDTRTAIETDVRVLQEGNLALGVPAYKGAFGVGGPLQRLADTWAPIAADADLILRNQVQILAFTQSADAFIDLTNPLKARLDEVARALSEADAPRNQLLLAMRQINLADTLARDIAILRSGFQGADGPDPARESRLFTQVLQGFQQGDSNLGITKLSDPKAVSALSQVIRLNADMQRPLDTIIKSEKQFAEVLNIEEQISDGSAQLLVNSQALGASFNTLSTHRPLPSVYLEISSGLLALFSLLGLALNLFRGQHPLRRN